MTTIYKALTPYGAFEATWGEDEESRVEYTGSAEAIAYFRDFLELQSLSGLGGALIQFDTLEPAELYGFCQSEKYGITVLPTEDDLREELEQETMEMTVMDAVGSAQSFELIGESAQIFGRLSTDADTFFADLDRLRVIMDELGAAAPAPAPSAADPASAYLQSVIDGTADLSHWSVPAELGKIVAAHAADAGMLALVKTAVTAYARYAIEQANEALKG